MGRAREEHPARHRGQRPLVEAQQRYRMPELIMLWVIGAWWVLVLLANLATVTLGLLPRRCSEPVGGESAVSVTVPVKGAGPTVAANVEALFRQDHPVFEILFAVAEPHDPAVALLQRIVADHPAIPSRLVTDPVPPSGNPKLDNIRRAGRWAQHELVLMCDVNARLRRDDLRRLSGKLAPGIGLLTVVPVAFEPDGFVGELEAAFFNGGGARWLLAGDRVGIGVGVGQTMLLRRSDLQRVGGIDAMIAGICEDAALATAVRRAGLGVRMARDPGWHPIGRRRFRELWQRHLRWQCCRKYHGFPLFLLDPAVSPLGMAFAGGLFWSHLAAWPAVSLAAGHLAGGFLFAALHFPVAAGPLSLHSPLA